MERIELRLSCGNEPVKSDGIIQKAQVDATPLTEKNSLLERLHKINSIQQKERQAANQRARRGTTVRASNQSLFSHAPPHFGNHFTCTIFTEDSLHPPLPPITTHIHTHAHTIVEICLIVLIRKVLHQHTLSFIRIVNHLIQWSINTCTDVILLYLGSLGSH